jgi:hypothetical protein
MTRILGSCIALAIIIVMVYPFARDAYHRYEVARRLDPQERVAFENWSGDPASFIRSLKERCELTNGPNAPACDAYRY